MFDLGELSRRLVKYLIEGLFVALAAYTIPKRFINIEETLLIALIATATFTIEDTAPPTIDTTATNLTVECDGNGNVDDLNSWLASQGGASASDSCNPGQDVWVYRTRSTGVPGHQPAVSCSRSSGGPCRRGSCNWSCLEPSRAAASPYDIPWRTSAQPGAAAARWRFG